MKRKYEMVNGKLVQTGGEPETEHDREQYAERFADMCAHRSAPRGSTDSTFVADFGTLDRQLKDPRAIARLRANARKEGISLTGNEIYMPTFCRPGYTLDPKACFTQGDGKAEMRKRAEEIGTGCEELRVKKREPEEPPKPLYKLHPRIVRRQMRRELANPANAKVDRRELVEKIIHEHGPPA